MSKLTDTHLELAERLADCNYLNDMEIANAQKLLRLLLLERKELLSLIAEMKAHEHIRDKLATATNKIIEFASMAAQSVGEENKRLIKERDEWKRRAAQHGCDVDNGDPDCG